MFKPVLTNIMLSFSQLFFQQKTFSHTHVLIVKKNVPDELGML
jgi:hypothetical protein